MNIITFIDPIGRNIIGEQVAKSASVLTVKNPAMINVAQAQNGQLQVQLIPLFFAEFIDESSRSDGSAWDFNLSTLVLGDVKIDGRLVDQYTKVFNASASSPTPEGQGESVVKLFDE
jgi:hypothetical protein